MKENILLMQLQEKVTAQTLLLLTSVYFAEMAETEILKDKDGDEK